MANRLARTVKVTCPKCNNPQDSWDRLLFFFFFWPSKPCSLLQVHHLSMHPINQLHFILPHTFMHLLLHSHGPKAGWQPWTCCQFITGPTLTDKDRQPFTLTHTAHLKLPICLTCMFFWTVWKENPHRHRENHTQEDPGASNPWPFLLCQWQY